MCVGLCHGAEVVVDICEYVELCLECGDLHVKMRTSAHKPGTARRGWGAWIWAFVGKLTARNQWGDTLLFSHPHLFLLLLLFLSPPFSPYSSPSFSFLSVSPTFILFSLFSPLSSLLLLFFFFILFLPLLSPPVLPPFPLPSPLTSFL